jgi:hypothetical protein
MKGSSRDLMECYVVRVLSARWIDSQGIFLRKFRNYKIAGHNMEATILRPRLINAHLMAPSP